jgi:hypothetical protein
MPGRTSRGNKGSTLSGSPIARSSGPLPGWARRTRTGVPDRLPCRTRCCTVRLHRDIQGRERRQQCAWLPRLRPDNPRGLVNMRLMRIGPAGSERPVVCGDGVTVVRPDPGHVRHRRSVPRGRRSPAGTGRLPEVSLDDVRIGAADRADAAHAEETGTRRRSCRSCSSSRLTP